MEFAHVLPAPAQGSMTSNIWPTSLSPRSQGCLAVTFEGDGQGSPDLVLCSPCPHTPTNGSFCFLDRACGHSLTRVQPRGIGDPGVTKTAGCSFFPGCSLRGKESGGVQGGPSRDRAGGEGGIRSHLQFSPGGHV